MAVLHKPTLAFLILLIVSALLSAAVSFIPSSPQSSGVVGGREGALGRRRQLRGPGSWPPACRYKCGQCAPCRAVHVPIRPGTGAAPMEYYPEAWRCKCGNKLFMP